MDFPGIAALIAGLTGLIAGIVTRRFRLKAEEAHQNELRRLEEIVERQFDVARESLVSELSPVRSAQSVAVGKAEERERAAEISLAWERFENELARVDRELTKSVEEVAKDAEKSWWERFGVAVIVALISATSTFLVAWLGYIRPVPADCTAYVETLLAIHDRAPTNDAAVEASGSLAWGDFDDQCGSPAGFISPLGEP